MDAKESPLSPEGVAILVGMYQVAAQQYHASQEERWSLLYYGLVANSILVLAWAAVFAASPDSQLIPALQARRHFLCALSFAGIILTILWLLTIVRLISYRDVWENSVRDLEELVAKEGKRHAGTELPHIFRAGQKRWEKLRGQLTTPIGTKWLMYLVHLSFIGLYIYLFFLAYQIPPPSQSPAVRNNLSSSPGVPAFGPTSTATARSD